MAEKFPEAEHSLTTKQLACQIGFRNVVFFLICYDIVIVEFSDIIDVKHCETR